MKARIFLPCILFLAIAGIAVSQPLTLQIKDVRTNNLPVVRFKSFLSDAGVPVQQPGNAQYTLRENGLPVQFEIECPDGASNYLAMVLDNSGSMSGSAFTALREAAHRMVDSLKVTDQAAMYNFSNNGGNLVLDFTTDKALMHTSLDAMNVGGSTPLYYTTWTALQRLALQPGRKFCLVFTDGADTGGPTQVLSDEIVAYAVANNIIMFTIGFGNGSLSDDILRNFAVATGGIYYRIFSTDRMNEIFDAIAVEITSNGCNVKYIAEGCTDSLRILEMTADLGGRTATAVESVDFPWRPDTVLVYVDVPDEVGPGQQVLVYLRLVPGLDTGLPLSFSFLVRYDPDLLQLSNSQNAITVFTMAQGSTTRLDSIAPGLLRITAETFETVVGQGNLVGFALRGAIQDTSRLTPIEIDSLVVTAGCPNTVFVYPDTIGVCQCKRAVKAFTPEVIVFNGTYRMPVMVPDGALGAAAVFTSEVRYDPAIFTVASVDPVGAMTQDAALEWQIPQPGVVEVSVTNSFNPVAGEALYYVNFLADMPKSAQRADVVMPVVWAYADCCPETAPDDTSTVMLDGECDKIVRRRAQVTMEPASPNPAHGMTEFRFTVHEQWHSSASDAVVTLYSAEGIPVGEVYNGPIQPGEYNLPYDVSGLPAGTYYYTLRTDGSAHTRALVVVK